MTSSAERRDEWLENGGRPEVDDRLLRRCCDRNLARSAWKELPWTERERQAGLLEFQKTRRRDRSGKHCGCIIAGREHERRFR